MSAKEQQTDHVRQAAIRLCSLFREDECEHAPAYSLQHDDLEAFVLAIRDLKAALAQTAKQDQPLSKKSGDQMVTVTVLSPTPVKLSTPLCDAIKQRFISGGSRRLEIQDILEWGLPPDLLPEAERLRQEYGEIYLERREFLPNE